MRQVRRVEHLPHLSLASFLNTVALHAR